MQAKNTLIALALGAALATPAFAQQGVALAAGAQVDAPMQAPVHAPVPDPVPPVAPQLENGHAAARGAMNDANGMQGSQAEAPMATPIQSQGAENAAAHSSVVEGDLWSRLDADKDGTISATEASVDAGFNGGFGKMDADGNGMVSQAEYDAYAKADLGTGGQNAATGSQASTKLTWNNVDSDKDGKLSAEEVQGYSSLKANFASIDGNGDGFLTQDEYRAYAKASKQP